MKKSFKLLFLVHLPPPTHGAAVMCNHLVEITQGLSLYKSDIVSISLSSQIEEINKFSLAKCLILVKILWKSLVKLFIKFPDHTFISPSPYGLSLWVNFILLFLARIFGSETTLILHNKGYSKLTGINKVAAHYIFAKSNVLVLSELLVFDLPPHKRLFVLPNGIPKINFTRVVSTSNKLRLLFVSNLISEKGVIELVYAIKLVLDQIDCHLTIVGAEGDISIEDLSNLTKALNIQSKVDILGPVYGERKEKIFRSADLFVFPTFYKKECFPLVLLEAMSVGLPILSTYEGAIADIVVNGKTGRLIDKVTPENISQAIIGLGKDRDELTSMGNEARLRFIENFTLETFEEEWKNILNKITDDSTLC